MARRDGWDVYYKEALYCGKCGRGLHSEKHHKCPPNIVAYLKNIQGPRYLECELTRMAKQCDPRYWDAIEEMENRNGTNG